MSRSPRVGQIIAVRLGDEEYAGELVEVTEDSLTIAIRVEHDPRSVLPDTGSVTWKGKRVQTFGHAEMSCLTTVHVRLPRPKPPPARIDRRIAVDVWAHAGSNHLVASGFTQDLTGDGAHLDLNRSLPLDAGVEVSLYLGKDVLRVPARVEASAGGGGSATASVRFDPTAAARSRLTRYIFAHLRQDQP
jgi:hypothetical protein